MKRALLIAGFFGLVLAVSADSVQASIDWSVAYMIDESQSVFGSPQTTAPRDNRGLALSPDGLYLYAGYNNGPELRKIDLSLAGAAMDYTAATVAKTTASRGKAIAVDDAGRVYSADGSIKIFDANLASVQYTLSLSNVEGVATVREGGQLVLYCSNRSTGNLTRYLLTETGGNVTAAAVDAAWGVGGSVFLGANIRGVEVDATTGRVWVAGYASDTVYVVEEDGSGYQIIAGIDSPMDIAFDGASALVTQYTERTISVIDATLLSLTSEITVPWVALELDPDGQSGGGALSGIAVLAEGLFYVANESGQTADDKSTYGLTDSQSGELNGKFYTDLYADDNDPILFAAVVPEPAAIVVWSLLAVFAFCAVRSRKTSR